MPVPSALEQPTPRELVRERVYAQLRDAILTGVLLPGERLDEGELRRWLGVSGTPIRQALHTLTLEGLVETSPQSHTAVIAPRAEEVLENLQTIGVLAVGATVLTLGGLSESDREALAGLAADVTAAQRTGDVPAITGAAENYFRRMLELCPNPVTVGLVAQVGPSLGYHVNVTSRALDADLEALGSDYAELARALRSGEDSEAVAITRRIFRIR
ncbi:GntR family transcriptional regulator [Leifsonia sp. AG29]|uniref:GntR family transcriptional regulator n=1 Tax=Leifsonia sp. AG29 TaxID=2598860 RepID=UPI00131CC38D|nr:GntR family transcriptional regulator [Leifsonia sp. AG29]